MVISSEGSVALCFPFFTPISTADSYTGVYRAAHLSVVFGKHNFATTEPGQQTIRAMRYIVHGKFNETSYDNDIALVELRDDVFFTDHVRPICIPKQDAPDDTFCFATGWGYTGKCAFICLWRQKRRMRI